MFQPQTTPTQSCLFQDAIGVFDSGVGGLSVLRAIRAALPLEHLVYVADSGHAPYGDQSQAHITQRTLAVGHWLAGQGVRAITIACNTATVVAAKTLREQSSLPVVAIEPAIKPAVALTRSGVVGVLATRQTVQSASVARLVDVYGGNKRILLQACPGLVEAVEQADLHSAQTEALLREFITPLLEQGADTLVLGCTHYPFLRDTIARVAGEGVTLLDPAEAVARELTRRLAEVEQLGEHGLLELTQRGSMGISMRRPLGLTESVDLAQNAELGGVKFFTSGDVAQAQAVMSHLWGQPLVVQALP